MDKAEFHIKVQLQVEKEATENGLASEIPPFTLTRLSQLAGKVAVEIHGQWISVKDKIPPQGVPVLSFNPLLPKETALRLFINNDLPRQKWEEGITHWMSLPTLPEIQEKKA